MAAYYNEFDPFAAQWLRNLIDAGHIAKGDVDERSITEVKPDDIKNYTQCHFFAGIGVWSYALRQAGWSDDKAVWTGSCPCQPFSVAGKRKGTKDERHLWPIWFNLIRECKPDIIFGEQVSSKDALAWFDTVQDNLEDTNYAVGAIDCCAAGVGAPHIRQRLYWVANTYSTRLQRHKQNRNNQRTEGWEIQIRPIGNSSLANGMANTNNNEFNTVKRFSGETTTKTFRNGQDFIKSWKSGRASKDVYNGMAYAECYGCNENEKSGSSCSLKDERRMLEYEGYITRNNVLQLPDAINSFWRNSDWLYCRDGKWRPVRSGTFPLANGVTNRSAKLRAIGNTLVAEQAKTFIESYMNIWNELWKT